MRKIQIVLASKSPRRRELLSLITNDYDVLVSNVDESVNDNLSPKEKIESINLKKAEAVKKIRKDAVIISADTAVFVLGKQFGKPKNKEEAKNMLNALSGKTHSVITAFTVINGEKTVTKSVETKVTFRKLTEKEIEDYIASPEPYDKAGGYGIQGKAALFVRKIDGDYMSVVGLPVCALKQTLNEMGIF